LSADLAALTSLSGPAAADADRDSGEGRPPVVWFEVEDFIRYFDHFRNPTGLQRVPFEIYAEVERLYGGSGRVRFCRLSAFTKRLLPVGFDAVASAYLNPPGARAPWQTLWAPAQFWSELPTMLLVLVRHPIFFWSIMKAALRDLIGALVPSYRFGRSAQPGDVMIALGAPWGLPDYMRYVAKAKQRFGLKFAILIHDLIPIEHESFVDPRHVGQFRDWLQEAVAVADVLFTVSQYSRRALIRTAGQAGWPLPPVEVLQPGSGFSRQTTSGKRNVLPLPERYVLCVSTIEIRKNHRLLVRLWRRLLERHGAEAVPVLIFAGHIGWLVEDLIEDLAASGYLGGKIKLMAGLSDADLRALYDNCLFTVFPSFCEGWGLPVAESLAHGKFCVASNSTSIPEVGGDLIDYFDPSNEDDALTKLERVLLQPGYLQAREAHLHAAYRPRSWSECAQILIGSLNRLAPAIKRRQALSRA
jgi:glycosyltransferase involved in cell wall biosynthesis